MSKTGLVSTSNLIHSPLLLLQKKKSTKTCTIAARKNTTSQRKQHWVNSVPHMRSISQKKNALDIYAAANTAIAGYIIVSFIVFTAFLHDFRGVASTIRSRNHLEICEGFLLGISVCVCLYNTAG